MVRKLFTEIASFAKCNAERDDNSRSCPDKTADAVCCFVFVVAYACVSELGWKVGGNPLVSSQLTKFAKYIRTIR